MLLTHSQTKTWKSVPAAEFLEVVFRLVLDPPEKCLLNQSCCCSKRFFFLPACQSPESAPLLCRYESQQHLPPGPRESRILPSFHPPVRLPPASPIGRSRQKARLQGKLTNVVCRLPALNRWVQNQETRGKYQAQTRCYLRERTPESYKRRLATPPFSTVPQ